MHITLKMVANYQNFCVDFFRQGMKQRKSGVTERGMSQIWINDHNPEKIDTGGCCVVTDWQKEAENQETD